MTWQSTLALAFNTKSLVEQNQTVYTKLTQRYHQGALRIQKSLYPENGKQYGICHVIMLYPPAGIALGDKLNIEISLKNHAQAVMTTPGANKWYGNLPNYTVTTQKNKPEYHSQAQTLSDTYASQDVNVYLQDNSRIEWLPQENCFYNNSHVQSTNQFFLSPNASLIAWEINLLGREHHGESYNMGTIHLSNLFWRVDGENQKLLFADTMNKSAKDDWFGSQIGLNRHSVFATLWVVPSVKQHVKVIDWVKQLRSLITKNDLSLSCTQTEDVLIIRYLGDDVRQCFENFGVVRGEIRSFMWQQDNHLPRIWAT